MARQWRLLGLAFALVALLLVQVVGAPAATASCASPQIRIKSADPSVDTGGGLRRGGTIVIKGAHFGDDCYDEDPRPDGVQGALGEPLSGIELAFVQGAAQSVVATGTADDGYGFEVEVVVPRSLEPGEASLVAAGGNAGLPIELPVYVSDGAAIGSAEEVPVTFDAGGSSGDGGTALWQYLIGVVALGAVCTLVVRRRAAREVEPV